MFQLAKPMFLTCETPLHAGSGDSLGIVDLPIQREKHTSFPKIEASSLKGALRESFESQVDNSDGGALGKNIIKAFGPEETGGDGAKAGALGFTDARLLLFPVKSMKGVFAWVTCPKILRQFFADLQLCHSDTTGSLVEHIADGKALPLSTDQQLSFGDHFVLEEYTFTKAQANIPTISNKNVAEWLADHLFDSGSFWHEKAKKDILLLSDNDFKDFVNLSTEVITRTKIDNITGTVQTGALFTEEYLPAESVLYALVMASPEFKSAAETRDGEKRPDSAQPMMDFFANHLKKVFQLGGNATLGKGLLRTRLV